MFPGGAHPRRAERVGRFTDDRERARVDVSGLEEALAGVSRDGSANGAQSLPVRLSPVFDFIHRHELLPSSPPTSSAHSLLDVPRACRSSSDTATSSAASSSLRSSVRRFAAAAAHAYLSTLFTNPPREAPRHALRFTRVHAGRALHLLKTSAFVDLARRPALAGDACRRRHGALQARSTRRRRARARERRRGRTRLSRSTNWTIPSISRHRRAVAENASARGRFSRAGTLARATTPWSSPLATASRSIVSKQTHRYHG